MAADRAPVREPFLHELVSCVSAPTVALSGTDGQIRPGGAQGVLRDERRRLSMLLVDVDGYEPAAVGYRLIDAGRARFTGLLPHLGPPGADSTVRLDRERRALPDGMAETLTLVNLSPAAITTTVRIHAAVDLAPVEVVKSGAVPDPVPPATLDERRATWLHGGDRVTLEAGPGPDVCAFALPGVLAWKTTVPARARRELHLRLTVETGRPPLFLPVDVEPADLEVEGDADLTRLLQTGLDDLAALTLADPERPRDRFVAAGSPWFFTLFGRDSLWTARLTLPLGTELAAGTLRTLARRQGRRHDIETAEAPGKILHATWAPAVPSEADRSPRTGLPPVYFGTIDATALWICLLYEAWCWGLPDSEVRALLDPLEAASAWLIESGDADGDGLCEYIDLSGHGLANQGWKDSGDAIQFPDGTIARPPIALSEAQAYAYQAAMASAALLDAFERPGAGRLRTWAGTLRERFRESFWIRDEVGRFPAIALDGSKHPVPTAGSNLGHLLGTGLLDPEEAAAVAARLTAYDLDCGLGLRTMTGNAAGFNPLGYHTGSIWPHDTTIGILGLVREGHPGPAASLAEGLLRAAPTFGHRLPELFGGSDARTGEPVVAYPAACRPQAWAAAASVGLLTAMLGLDADVPAGVVRVSPSPAFRRLFPLRVAGLRLAGHRLDIEVDATGDTRVRTTAPLRVEEHR